MKHVLQMLLLLTAATAGVSACGNRGKLKSPAQIEAQEAKKAAREARREQGLAPEAEEARPAADERRSPAHRVFPVTPSNEVAQ